MTGDNHSTGKVLQRELDKAMQHSPDPASVMPVIVPSRYYEQWDAPHFQLPCRDLSVTWATMGEENTMVYLSKHRAKQLDDQGIEYPLVAIQNLQRYSPEGMASHVKSRPDGTPLFFIAMHQDGLGPSRLLLHSELARHFPLGYWLAIPEKSMGLVISKALTTEEMSGVKTLVEGCFQDGTSPMLERWLEPDELAIPAEWLKLIG